MTIQVLVTARELAQPGLDVLREARCEIRFADTVELLRHELSRAPAHAIISRTLPLTGDLIRANSALRVISRHGAGADNVDLAAATDCGVPVLVAARANAASVVELTVGLLIAAARAVPAHDCMIRAGRWERSNSGMQLAGRTLGLVGLGAVGLGVARVAAALGMHVRAFDPFVDHVPADVGLERAATLPELLARADVLSLHCPLTPETFGIIGALELAMLPHGALVVNTARGALIDEPALAEALASGQVAGAGLDTFVTEPLDRASPLLAHPNVVVSPHMGGSTREAAGAVAAAAAVNALRVLRGEAVPLQLCLNPAALTAGIHTARAVTPAMSALFSTAGHSQPAL